MKTYLVGGAVRDMLLGLKINDRDYCVVGATPEELIKQGFKPVGKEFPVFLHPKTNEEYALARTERKTGSGHKGFDFHASPDVTLEEDLSRRDLTINAIAQDDQGNLIDPYNGESDLQNRILKHVSDAFSEDPLRVLRVARFMAQLADYSFSIHPDTLSLMKKLCQHEDIKHLSGERIWQETVKALSAKNSKPYFETLKAVGYAKLVINEQHLQLITTESAQIKFAVLFYNQLNDLPFTVPSDFLDLAKLLEKTKALYEAGLNRKHTREELLELFKMVDVIRRPERFEKWLKACEVISQSSKNTNKLKTYATQYTSVDAGAIAKKAKENGENIKAAVESARLAAFKID